MAASFGVKLRKTRLDLGLTQMAMARIIGNTPVRISEWERGVRQPRPLTQEAILMVLDNHAGKKRRRKNKRR